MSIFKKMFKRERTPRTRPLSFPCTLADCKLLVQMDNHGISYLNRAGARYINGALTMYHVPTIMYKDVLHALMIDNLWLRNGRYKGSEV